MFAISPQLSKILLAFLLLTPWFSLYQKILFPHLAQTGFDGAVITLVELIFIIFIAAFGKHPRLTKQGALLLAALVGWHVSGVISAYLSEHFYSSLIKQIEYLVHCMFAYSVWVFLSQTQKQEKTAWFLVFTFLWIIYYILCAWYINQDPYNYNWVQGTPLINNIRHLGYLQIVILPFLIFPIINNHQSKYLISSLLLIIFWTSVIWTGARSTFLASIGLSMIMIWFYRDNRKEIAISLVLSSIIGWFIALQFATSSASMDPYRLLFLDSRVEQASINQISSGRLDIWLGLLEATWHKNIWFGLGPDTYSYIRPLINSQVSQAHNTLIQLFSGIGIFGISFIVMTVVAILRIWSASKSNNITNIARLSLIGVLSASMLDGHFYHSFSLVWIMIVTALGFSPPKHILDETKKRFILPLLIIATCTLCLPSIQKHWHTYIQQQFPLEHKEQIDAVASFPSYYHPIEWIYSDQTKPELRKEAIDLGQKNGPRFCNYYLIEFLESDLNNQKLLENNLIRNCSLSELRATENPEILKLLNKGKNNEG
tara:strand:+ start:403 stop:2028 length:1626 start_codon:yes stop_codon:yes gene_type:complete